MRVGVEIVWADRLGMTVASLREAIDLGSMTLSLLTDYLSRDTGVV